MTTAVQDSQMIQSDKVVSSLIALGFSSYEVAKERALKTRFIGAAVEAPIKYIEDKVDDVKKMNPYDTNSVIKGLDERLAGYIKYGEEKKDSLVKFNQEKKEELTKFSEEKKEVVVKFADEKLKEVREVPLVATVETKVTDAMGRVLDISEELIESKLPAEEGEEQEQKEEEGASYIQAKRAFRLSKVATRRMRQKVFANVPELKLRERMDVVHVDLMKYSEYLDLEVVKGKSSEVKDLVLQKVEEFPVILMDKVEEAKGFAVQIKPTMKKRTGELMALAAKYREAAQARISVTIPQAGQIWLIYDSASQKTAKFFDNLLADIEKSGGTEESKEKTIEDGLLAIAKAAKIRFDSVSASLQAKFQKTEGKDKEA